MGISERNRTLDEWFPSSQIFSAPWANNVNLKVGETVYIKRFGFEPYNAVVEKLPESKSGSFLVKYDGYQTTEWARGSNVFSSTEPARSEVISPGYIVYYNQMH